MSAADLGNVYSQGMELIRRASEVTRINRGSAMPSAFAALNPSYLVASRHGLYVRVAGCVDAAVFVMVTPGLGVELSWGEECPECHEIVWKVPQE